MQDVNWDEVRKPEDDGAANHLRDMMLADVPLPSTDGADVSVAAAQGRIVIFCYPMTAEHGRALPTVGTRSGAPGCTSQACAFRDLAGDLADRGVDRIIGISTQSTSAQTEAKARLNLPYPLLSDHALNFANAMGLPTFEADGRILLKRLTMIAEGGTIRHVHYPVFPPNQDAAWVRNRLAEASQPR